MRFLADKNISYRLCVLLDSADHRATHVDQFSPGAAEDAAIMDFARFRRSAQGRCRGSDEPARDTCPATAVAIADV